MNDWYSADSYAGDPAGPTPLAALTAGVAVAAPGGGTALALCGYRPFGHRFVIAVTANAAADQATEAIAARRSWLEEAERTLAELSS